jgi:hypothetical protein
LIRETPIAVAKDSDKLPSAVYKACLTDDNLFEELKLLSPRSHENVPGAIPGGVPGTSLTLEHAEKVCNVNATQRTNVDDVAFNSFDAISGEGGGGRSIVGSSLPTFRSLLNHSCAANTATLHLNGGSDHGFFFPFSDHIFSVHGKNTHIYIYIGYM